MEIDLPYIMQDTDRHGNLRTYLRMPGHKKVRLREPFGSEAFQMAYWSKRRSLETNKPELARLPKSVAKDTFEWIARQYLAQSPKYRGLTPRSQRVRESILRECIAEPVAPDSALTMGQCPLAQFTSKHVKIIRDRKSAKPGAANNRMKSLRAVFNWAFEAEIVTHNPTEGVASVDYVRRGFHTWTPAEVEQYVKRHPPGTKAYLAMALMLYTGARRSDAVVLGRQHVRDGWLTFTPAKTDKATGGKEIALPLLPELAAAIKAGPTGDLTFIMTEYGRGFTANGFGAWFRARCDAAGLPHCAAHGLRKAGATIAAENGATDRELMAIFGWASAKEATTYTKKAEQKRLAARGMHKLVAERNADKIAPLKAG